MYTESWEIKVFTVKCLSLQSTSWIPAAHARAVGSCVTPADAADLETFKYCSWVIAQVTGSASVQDSTTSKVQNHSA